MHGKAAPMRNTRSMILAALFAALTAVGAFLRIPTPVSSFTLQVLFTAMAGLLLGKNWGMASQAAYVLLGVLGLPVFTGGGGPGFLLQPTGGFALGLIPMAWVIGRMAEGGENSLRRLNLACLAGLAALYAVGLPYMHGILTLYLQMDWSVGQTLVSGMLIFLPWDLLKLLLASVLCVRIRPAVMRIL